MFIKTNLEWRVIKFDEDFSCEDILNYEDALKYFSLIQENLDDLIIMINNFIVLYSKKKKKQYIYIFSMTLML